MLTTEARQVALRRLHLEIVVRVRRVGPVPVLILLAWMLIALGQEPKALRSFGIVIGPQAAWVGGSVTLPLLFTSERIQQARGTRILANLLLLFAVAVGQAWLAFVMEVMISGHASANLAARSTAYFALAWLPLACSFAGLVRAESSGGFASMARMAIMLTTAFLGVGFGAHAWQQGLTSELLAAVALASLSGLLASTMDKTPSSCSKCA